MKTITLSSILSDNSHLVTFIHLDTCNHQDLLYMTIPSLDLQTWLDENNIDYKIEFTHSFYIDLTFNKDEEYILFELTFDFIDIIKYDV